MIQKGKGTRMIPMMTTRSHLRLLVGILAMMGAGVVHGEDTALDMWNAQRTTFEKFVDNLRPLGKHRIDQVLQLRVEKKFLAVYTPLPSVPGEESMRATLDGIRGTALVDVHREDTRSGPAQPDRFSLNVMNFPAARQATTLSIHSQLQPNQISISQTIQTTEGPLHQVMLTQQRGPQSNDNGLVQLAITDSGAANQAPQQLNFESPDFFTFIHEYPQQTEQYVRPLLRELGQEAVFAPDPMVAWQVFSDLRQPDPRMAQKVRQLLPRLDADDYHVRNAALTQLQRLGRDGASVLVHMDRSKLTPEQNARIDRALLPYGHLPTREVSRLRSDAGFLLDCLYSEDTTIRQAAIARLRSMFRPDIEFDTDAPPIPRNAAVALLREQFKPVR